jgi:hypothetical protein
VEGQQVFMDDEGLLLLMLIAAENLYRFTV